METLLGAEPARTLSGAKTAPPLRLAVAVSGGADSMALAMLAHAYAQAHGGNILALTVDHGLRAEARAEAEEAGRRLAARGIAHRILTWEGEKPRARLQERARHARYRLLFQACRAEGIDTLCVAHNLEDQIETFWMRLGHGSGLDGLCGMVPAQKVQGVRVLRPVLNVPRAELRAVCRLHGLEWAEDPSNANEKFLRVRLRQFEDFLAQEGLSPQRLARTLQRLAEERDALRALSRDAYARIVTLHGEAGYATVERAGFEALPRALRRRVLAQAMACVAPVRGYPLGRALDMALEKIDAPAFAGCTLAGCDISAPNGKTLVLTRELAAMTPAPLENGMVWDGRFVLRKMSGHMPQGVTVEPLGEAGIAALRKILKDGGADNTAAVQRLDALPFRVRRGLACLRNGENIVMVPYLSWALTAFSARLEGVRVTPLADENAADDDEDGAGL